MTQPGIDTTPTRLTSLDAYRGFIMLSLVSVAFGLKAQAQHFGPSRFWRNRGQAYTFYYGKVESVSLTLTLRRAGPWTVRLHRGPAA